MKLRPVTKLDKRNKNKIASKKLMLTSCRKIVTSLSFSRFLANLVILPPPPHTHTHTHTPHNEPLKSPPRLGLSCQPHKMVKYTNNSSATVHELLECV